MHCDSFEKVVPCGGSGSEFTALVIAKGNGKYKIATSFSFKLEL